MGNSGVPKESLVRKYCFAIGPFLSLYLLDNELDFS